MNISDPLVIFEFDDFRVDRRNLAVWHSGELVPLPPKAVELLLVFIDRPGAIISKDELLDAVWGDTFVEESNLSHNIYLLRKTFRSTSDKNFIDTVPRRGYRFNAEVVGIMEQREITIERSVYTETIIEETSIEFADDSNSPTVIDIDAIPVNAVLNEKPNSTFRVGRMLPVAFISFAVILVMGIAGAFWYSSAKVTSERFNDIRSIAVIPFDFQGGDDETVGIRITDALVTGLHSNSDLNIRPISAVMAYVRDDRNPMDIGKDLLVDAVIDGRLQQEGDRLRLNMQLISVRTGETLWSGQFNGKIDRLLKLQDDFTAKFFADNGLDVPKKNVKKDDGELTKNSEAFEHYLKGRYFFARRNKHDLLAAERHFKAAIELDSEFAEAIVGLANILAFRQNDSKEAAGLARRAIEIAPDMAEPYATLAFIMSFHEWNWKASEAEFLKAVYLDPRNSLVRQWYANNLMMQGRYVEAEAQFLRALELDPTSSAITTDLAQLYYYQRQFDRSLATSKKAIELQGDHHSARDFQAWSQFHLWKQELKADPNAERPSSLKRIDDSMVLYGKAKFSTDASNDADYGTFLMKRYNYHMWLGNKNEMLTTMENMLEMNHFMLPFVLRDPNSDLVREDPRFEKLLAGVNFEK